MAQHPDSFQREEVVVKLFIEYPRAPHLNTVVTIPKDIARSIQSSGQEYAFLKGVTYVVSALDDEPVVVTYIE